MSERWTVDVYANGEKILTLADDHCAGKSEFTAEEEETIRGASEHLLAFIGRPSLYPNARPSKLRRLALRLLDPEDLGLAATAEIRDAAREALGLGRVET